MGLGFRAINLTSDELPVIQTGSSFAGDDQINKTETAPKEKETTADCSSKGWVAPPRKQILCSRFHPSPHKNGHKINGRKPPPQRPGRVPQ